MHIIYSLTDKCNWGCKHCYKRRAGLPILERSVQQCHADIARLKQAGHTVGVYGSENLTKLGFLEIYHMVGQRYILSNGLLIFRQPDVCQRLIEYGIERVDISWHMGTDSALQSMPTDVVRNAVLNCIKAGLKVRILCVVTALNYCSLLDIAREVREMGATAIKFLQLLPSSEDLSRLRLSPEQKVMALARMVAIRHAYAVDELQVTIHGSFNAVELTEKRRRAVEKGEFCPAGKSFLAIETNNDVFPCPFLNHERFKIGVWDGSRLQIENRIVHDGKSCLAEAIFIRNKKVRME